MYLNREFYHNIFCETLADIYSPVIVTIINTYYQDAQKMSGDIVENFKKILLDKVKEVKLNKESVYSAVFSPNIKNIDELHQVLNSININYVKMHSKDGLSTVSRVTETDLFACTFIAVARHIYNHSYLFADYDCCNQNEIARKRAKVAKYIRKGIERGINKCLVLNFIPHDRDSVLDTVELILGDQRISMDKKKIIELFQNQVEEPKVEQQKVEQPKNELRKKLKTKFLGK